MSAVGEGWRPVVRALRQLEEHRAKASALAAALLASHGELSEAAEELRRGYQDTRDPVLLLNLGRTLAYQGKLDEAAEAFREASEQLGLAAKVEYVTILVELGLKKRASKEIRRLLKQVPERSILKEDLKSLYEYTRASSPREEAEALKVFTAPTLGMVARLALRAKPILLKALAEKPVQALRAIRDVTPSPRALSELVEEAYHKSPAEALKAAGEVAKAAASKEVEEWATREKLAVLERWKPGYLLWKAHLYFSEKCSQCLDKGRCWIGLSPCPHDKAFTSYLKAEVERDSENAVEGREPKPPEELAQLAQEVAEAVEEARRAARSPWQNTG